jgi:hypothetical protein
MKRPSIYLLLTLVLVAASGTLIIRLRSETPQSPAVAPEKTAQAAPIHGKVDAAMATRQPSIAGTAMPLKNQTSATATMQTKSSSRHAADSQIAAAPSANVGIPVPDQITDPSQTRPETSPVGDQPPLPAIQLADDVRLPAALMPHDTSKESPVVAAARAAIGDRFYRELQEIAAKDSVTDPATKDSAAKDSAAKDSAAKDSAAEPTTVVIHQSPATENALKRANEEYRALFGDEAFNRKTMDTQLEVKLPPGSSD